MVQATIATPTTNDTTIIADGQAPGSITPAFARQWNDSLASLPIGTTQTGSTYTFVLGDFGAQTLYNAAGAGTFTIPTNASVAFGVGTLLHFRQIGAGQLTIAGAGGVTVNTAASLLTRTQGSAGYAHQTAANTWFVDGDMQ